MTDIFLQQVGTLVPWEIQFLLKPRSQKRFTSQNRLTLEGRQDFSPHPDIKEPDVYVAFYCHFNCLDCTSQEEGPFIGHNFRGRNVNKTIKALKLWGPR